MENQLSDALMAQIKANMSKKLMEAHAAEFHDVTRTFSRFFTAITPNLERLFLEGVTIGRLHQRTEEKK